MWDRRRGADGSEQETMKALHDVVQSGKVRYIGASSMWTWQFAHYNHVAEKVIFSYAHLLLHALTYAIERMDAVRIDAGPVLACVRVPSPISAS